MEDNLTIIKSPIANAIIALDDAHVVTTSDYIYDEGLNQFQHELNLKISSDISNFDTRLSAFENSIGSRNLLTEELIDFIKTLQNLISFNDSKFTISTKVYSEGFYLTN